MEGRNGAVGWAEVVEAAGIERDNSIMASANHLSYAANERCEPPVGIEPTTFLPGKRSTMTKADVAASGGDPE